jgi:uncharacterized protein involved in exopolysaccharide biosynthesis
MENNTTNNNDINSGNLIVFFYRWRKPLIMVSAVAAICSIIVSLIIEDKYKSTVVLFPTTTSSISKALLSENNTGKEDVMQLGEEEEAEQMLQILNSDRIRNRIVEKYNLMKHYDISENEKYRHTKLQKEYNSNISFERTEFMSVEINVLDHSADTAALIANDISNLIDTINNEMRKVVAMQAYRIVEQKYNDQKNTIQVLEDSLNVLRRKGIIDYESQAERLTEQLAIAIVQGKNGAVKELERRLNVLGEGGSYVILNNQLEFETEKLTLVHAKYEEAKMDSESSLQHKFIVNSAFAAEKKSYPIRWLIVVVSTLASFLLTLILLLFVESIKSIDFKQ